MCSTEKKKKVTACKDATATLNLSKTFLRRRSILHVEDKGPLGQINFCKRKEKKRGRAGEGGEARSQEIGLYGFFQILIFEKTSLQYTKAISTVHTNWTNLGIFFFATGCEEWGQVRHFGWFKREPTPTSANQTRWMDGWYVDRKHSFSLYSYPMVNHSGQLCTNHSHGSAYL